MSNFTEFGIFMSLLDGKLHKANELAEKFEISTKTVYRQTNKLAYAGFPITTYAGKNGGIMLAQKFKCQTWFFSENELAYIKNLVASSHLDPTTSSIICSKIDELMEKENFAAAKQQSNRFFVDNSSWFAKKPSSIKNYADILDACINNNQVQLTYGTNNNKRIINPYCIVQKEGYYYVYAYCTNREQFRLFKLCRIKNYSILSSIFSRQQINLQKMPWNTTQNQTKIIIETNPDTAADIASWTSCKCISNNIYAIDAIFNNGLIHKLMEYRDKIKVVKPQIIIDNIINCCKIVSNIYQN